MTHSELVYSIILFIGLFIIGTVLCLWLYKWDYSNYFKSQLWVKTYYWIPIFCVFLAVLCVQLWAAALITILAIGTGTRELLRAPKKDWLAWLYMLAVTFAISHLILFFLFPDIRRSVTVLLALGFISVLSDVIAYFFGSFLGKHKLPFWINENKSWEGVVGQLVGAIIGFYLIAPVLYPTPQVILAILVGVASIIGDISNSIVKRRANIKDWGKTIPGHGGVLDRFASLAFAIAAGFWWMILT